MVVVDMIPGEHTIKFSLNGYDTLEATINVDTAGVVTCVSVTGGLCGGSALPRVSISSNTVTGYLKVTSTPGPRTPPCGNYGDIDGDGYVTQADLELGFKIIGTDLTEDQLKRFDVNGNGRPDYNDLVLIGKYVRGEISTFPVCITHTPVPVDICTWIADLGGWNNLNWTDDILQAYYVYIETPGYTIGYSPVTWDSVLGLYYYYIGLKDMGNSKIGCVLA